MNKIDRDRLSSLLSELINAQDELTHMVEKGIEFSEDTKKLREKRNGKFQEILYFSDDFKRFKTIMVPAGTTVWRVNRSLPFTEFRKNRLDQLAFDTEDVQLRLSPEGLLIGYSVFLDAFVVAEAQ